MNQSHEAVLNSKKKFTAPFSNEHQKNRLLLIQALRGVAALMVVCYHAGTLYAMNSGLLVFGNIFKFGHTGVEFFFVLSGFIIYYIHKNDIGDKKRFTSFAYKRFTRIYPVYWSVIFFKMLFKRIDISSFFIAFILLPTGQPYLTTSWTLSFEVLFYCCFGIAILTTKKLARFIFTFYVAVLIIVFIFKIVGFSIIDSSNFYLSFFFNPYIIEFLLGMLSAHLVINNIYGRYYNAFLVSGIVLFISSAVTTVILDNHRAMVSHVTNKYEQAEQILCWTETYSIFFFGIPSMLIIMGAAMKENIRAIKVPRILLKLGDASYSIYLIHAVIINIVTVKLNNASPQLLNYTILPVIAFAVFLGCVFSNWVEKPLLKKFSRLRLAKEIRPQPK